MRVYTPKSVIARLIEYAGRDKPTEFPEKARGALTGAYSNAIAATLENDEIDDKVTIRDLRLLLLGYIFGDPNQPLCQFKTSNQLIPQQWHALSRWHSELNSATGGFIPRPAFGSEVAWMLTQARSDYSYDQMRVINDEQPRTLAECWQRWNALSEYGSYETTDYGVVLTAIQKGGIIVDQYDEGSDRDPYYPPKMEPAITIAEIVSENNKFDGL